MSNEKYIQELNKLSNIIRNLKKIYEWLNLNRTTLENLINIDRHRVHEEHINVFYENLPFRINQNKKALIEIREIIHHISNGVVEPQYDNFLNKELLSINWQNFNVFDDNTIHLISVFEKVRELKIPLEYEQFILLDKFQDILFEGRSLEDKLINKISSIGIFSKIQGLNNNIVIIGSNGSGKSRFARNLEGKLANGLSIISAQKFLIYSNPNQIYVNNRMIQQVKDFQKRAKLANEENLIGILTTDLNNLILALLEEELGKTKSYYDGEQRIESLLNKTIKIWESLITHRKINHKETYQIFVETLEGMEYDFNNLSDGEKALFYYIGHVLLAESNSYILIDEPENHLHLSICIKLWDMLESERSDCKFIYITHDLNFAVSRNQKSLIWNKDYNPPFAWDFEIIHENDTIPEILILEIMGSRKNVLFCEGDDRNSLDYKIYSKLFKNLNVIPVIGHEEVIKYATAFNKNKSLSSLTAYGIIDGDAWTDEEIESKRKNNIFTLPFNEIENALCQKEILEEFVIGIYEKPDKVQFFIDAFFIEIDKNKEKISVKYANNRINNYIKSNLFKESRDIKKLKTEVESFLNGDNIETFYSNRLNLINKDISERNYESLLKYVDGKKMLTKQLANDYIVKDFEEWFIKLLTNNDSFKEVVCEKIIGLELNDLISAK